MDTDRNLKFSIPPLVMVLSLMFGMLTTPDGFSKVLCIMEAIGKVDIGGAIVVALTGGSLLIAGGFLISVLGYVFLRIFLQIVNWCYHPFCSQKQERFHWCADYFSPEDYISFINLFSLDSIRTDYYYYGFCMISWIVYGGAFLDAELRDWFLRRWNTFLVHVHSMAALFLALFLGWYWVPESRYNYTWLITSSITMVLLCWNAFCIRMESTRMWHFLAITGKINISQNTTP